MQNFLKIGSWNIHHLKTPLFYKSRDKLFTSEISGYDIVGLYETKHSIDDFFEFVGGYRSISVPRPKEANFPVSGGIIVLLKNDIQSGVTILNNSCSEIQWLKLSKDFFGFDKDLFICYTYLAPSNSSYVKRNNLDILSILQRDVGKYSQMGDILICGDLNARTGTEIECTESDLYIPTSFDHVDYLLSVRSSQDCIVNERGRDLIDFCVSQDLHCLNGRTVGDLSGKFTSFQYNGNSVVDYCLISNSVTNNVLYFKVHDHIPVLSYHSKLTCQIVANYQKPAHNSKSEEIDLPASYIWNKESTLLFQTALRDYEVQNMINTFLDYSAFLNSTSCTIPNNSSLEICADNALQKFNKIIHLACRKTLKISHGPKVLKDKKSKT